MTEAELKVERKYVYDERLALLGCFDRIPAADEHNLAVADADAHCEALKKAERMSALQELMELKSKLKGTL